MNENKGLVDMDVTKVGMEAVHRERLRRKVAEFISGHSDGGIPMRDIVRKVCNQDVVGQSMKMKLVHSLREHGWETRGVGRDKTWHPAK